MRVAMKHGSLFGGSESKDCNTLGSTLGFPFVFLLVLTSQLFPD